MKIYVENLIDCLNEKVHGYKYLYHFLFMEKFSYIIYEKPKSHNYFSSSVFPTHFDNL